MTSSSTVGMPVIMDHQGFISPGAHPSHMFVSPGDVQSKGLPSNGVPVSMSPPPPIQRDELKNVLMHQLEYYFSKDNLGTDKYLCKSMTEYVHCYCIQDWDCQILWSSACIYI